MDQEMQKEQEHFDRTMALIEENLESDRERERRLKEETDDLYAAVTRGRQTELYNQLAAAYSILDHVRNTIKRSEAARIKPYFGRIDYEDLEQAAFCSLYIGKNGISRNQDVVIVDWRAPVSSVYYENEIGEGSYTVPLRERDLEIPIDLKRKRTYDTDHGRLLGYYDNNVAANDELLVKYLAKNKDAVLGDIIATIQKEQNEIIRDTPYRNRIVQGVAGSGKTTVAMHRISYILYNYEGRIHPSEFCIIGSSDMLLSYITSGLPELDVANVRGMRMDEIFRHLLGKQWKKAWKPTGNGEEEARKSHLPFIRSLDRFLDELRERLIPAGEVSDPELGVILSADNIRTTLRMNRHMSVAEVAALLNERVAARIISLMDREEREALSSKRREYRRYFDPLNGLEAGVRLYLSYLDRYEAKTGIRLPSTRENLEKNRFDVYDLAALTLIHRRLTEKAPTDEFSQIVVDEGQDFGEAVYYVLKQALAGCYFTVMGDVSQNVNYETGMNDWDALRSILFDGEKDRFCTLLKSYRNTIEISEFAGDVLREASEGQYKIQPVIRRGRPVEVIEEAPENLFVRAAGLIGEIRERGNLTIAVICRTEQEAREVEERLTPLIAKEPCGKAGGAGPEASSDTEPESKRGAEKEPDQGLRFHSGVMVLPVGLTKGLEFDAVILWKPDKKHYGQSKKDAKLLYVAITRALHELYLLGQEPASPLFASRRGSADGGRKPLAPPTKK